MTTETTVASPIVEGNGSANPDADPKVTPLLVDTSKPDPSNGASATSGTGEPAIADPNAITSSGDGSSKPGGGTPDWAQKRINELTAKRYEAERNAQEAELKAKNAETRAAALMEQIAKTVSGAAPAVSTDPAQKPTASATPPAPLGEEEIEKRAVAKAQVIAQAAKFNETCNNIVETGKKDFKDWDDAIKNLNMVGAIGAPDKVSPEFLETVVELRNPHQILHHLGMNPEEAAKIAAMPPKKMALELARVESTLLNKPAEKTPVSGAPAPVIPINGRGVAAPGSLDDPNLSADEWYNLRAKQIEEKRNRYRRA